MSPKFLNHLRRRWIHHAARRRRASLERVASLLNQGTPPADDEFDQFLPHELRLLSRQFWSPLTVTLRIAEWLTEFGIGLVVDVGSGAGKFCVATALAGRAQFVGIEHRENLVVSARHLARLFKVDHRVSFVHRKLDDQPVHQAQAYYLFNPFEENLLDPIDRIDNEVELSVQRHSRDIAAAERLLHEAPAGTYLVTLDDFGGTVPDDYVMVRVDRQSRWIVRMYRKRSATIIDGE